MAMLTISGTVTAAPGRFLKTAARGVRRRSFRGAALHFLFLVYVSVALTVSGSASAHAENAKNVILFIGDAGGLSTLNAGGVVAHDRPLSLYIHSMPHIGLLDTSALDKWVTDSAAGMTAIITGHKTNYLMLSMVPGAGGQAPTAVPSLIEMAEVRGLSTGVITNMPIWDATPAACYAHAALRSERNAILDQLVKPTWGDGVDVVVGKGRTDVDAWAISGGSTSAERFSRAGYRWFDDPAAIDPTAHRAAAIIDGDDFEPIPVVSKAVRSLATNRKGYVLMVEWDMHADDLRTSLRRVRQMDNMIREVARVAGRDTLIIFTADHSFGLRMRGGDRATPYGQQLAAGNFAQADTPDNKLITVSPTHTGEEVLIAAQGPGAERVHGFMANADIFGVMTKALGWR